MEINFENGEITAGMLLDSIWEANCAAEGSWSNSKHRISSDSSISFPMLWWRTRTSRQQVLPRVTEFQESVVWCPLSSAAVTNSNSISTRQHLGPIVIPFIRPNWNIYKSFRSAKYYKIIFGKIFVLKFRK